MRSLLFPLVLLPFTACAAGEPIDPATDDLTLADETIDPILVQTELVVDVADDEGRPIIADAVWISTGIDDATDADCMIHEGLGECRTWFIDAETGGTATVWADVCGELFTQTLTLALEPGADDYAFSAHIGVEAEATACGRALPPRPTDCPEVDEAPAVTVDIVDHHGDPVDVPFVGFSYEHSPLAPADCVDWPHASGCAEWATPMSAAGRYRVEAELCGKKFASPWLAVELDDSGCKPMAQHIDLAVDPAACKLGG